VNPVAAVAHVLAIAAGIWGGLWIMGKATPDLPDPDAEAGVTATAPEDVSGGADESLFRQTPLFWALDQLGDQLAAGQAVVRLHVEPGTLSSESREEQDGLIDPADVPASAPEWIVSQIAQERPQVTLEKVRYMDLVATEKGPRWYVQLVSDDPKLDPPWTYTADFEGDLLETGGAEPRAIPDE
jgi:hypothetical protein